MVKRCPATGQLVTTRTEDLAVVTLTATLLLTLFVPAARDLYACVFVAVAQGFLAIVEGAWDCWLWILNS